MSIPGWYPDPAGQPNRFRYWFGEQWSEVTTDNPYLPPPPPPGALPPEPPEQPPAEQLEPAWGISGGWTPMEDAPAGGDGARGNGPLIALIAVLLALLLVGGGVGG